MKWNIARPARKRKLDYTRLSTDPLVILSFAIASIIGVVPLILAYRPATQFIIQFLSTIPIWGTFLILFASGIMFFWLRSRYRMVYGAAEYVVGLTTAVNVFLPLGFDYSQLKPIAMLQVLGGVYIMVRGLDNFGVGIKETASDKTSRLAQYWEKLFGKR